MLAGFGAAVVAVVLYAFASVMQAVGARRGASNSSGRPRLTGLVMEPAWILGVGLLVLGFLAFVLSTRVLPLPVAEAVRGSYLVLTVVLDHLFFRTRFRVVEAVGATLALIGLVLFVAPGWDRGLTTPRPGAAWVMLSVLAVVATASLVVPRTIRQQTTLAGAAEAALGGMAFATLDIGVRSLPAPFSIDAAITSATCWIGAAAAPLGLLLFSRATTRTSVGLAAVVLTVVTTVGASVLAVLLFHDTSNGSPATYALSAALTVIGLGLMMAVAPPAAAAASRRTTSRSPVRR